jgi:predicted DNA-binding transcriptional regulator AlpA
MPPRRILRLPQVLECVGASKSEWYRKIAAGLAPRGRKLGPPPTRAVGWFEDVIADYQQNMPVAAGGTRPTPRLRRRRFPNPVPK